MSRIENETFNITKVYLRVLEPAPAVIPFQDSTMGPFNTFGLAILTIEDEDGCQGESPVYGSYTNILETCLLPILFYSKHLTYTELYRKLYWSVRNEGFRGPAAALVGQIDIALHDLAARKAGIPLHKYLGAIHNDVTVYGSGGGTNYTLQQLEAEVDYFLQAGVDCYKMKVGKDHGANMQEDVERVKFVRNLVGKNMKLAVDANQIWTTEQALRFVEMTAAEDLAWFEEPVHSASYEQIQQLCSRTKMVISYGESERSSKMFPTLASMGVQHLQPVPMHLGGVKEWVEVKDLAINANLTFSSGGYSMYTASLMATAPKHCQVEYLYAIMAGLEQYFYIRPQWKNGKFILPEIDGMPVRIDWKYCTNENKIIRSQTWTSKNVKEYRPNVSL
ncbi:hypothetical protein A3860_23630 [Niastella vici]|uniref:Mandelate racemase/muconate lactonizing enzyme C-terminal domain-containing protein n=1 Tax=Niastella vici TaxID=1703345 RepID=A0A1V9G012_9BACT|nr:mandelate racemase/muconate lactonizing enzyme family protein [Niastella vici]OQP63922.1 hypothetical protein A3860_23630 [Niastella vici]